jgi:hypothetical protein
MFLGHGDIQRPGMKRHRNQQRLHGDGTIIESRLQLFISDPLMGSVHVDNYQPLGVLSQNVDAMQLPQREAEGGNFRYGFGRRRDIRPADLAEQGGIEIGAFRHAQRHGLLPGKIGV